MVKCRAMHDDVLASCIQVALDLHNCNKKMSLDCLNRQCTCSLLAQYEALNIIQFAEVLLREPVRVYYDLTYLCRPEVLMDTESCSSQVHLVASVRS